jgi:hypothetical protein
MEFMNDHDINFLIVDTLIRSGTYNLRCTNKYFYNLYMSVLKSSLHDLRGKSLKKCAMICSYYFGSFTFVPLKKRGNDTSLTHYVTKENKDVILEDIKFVMGMWKFVTGPMYFLINAKRTKSLLIRRNPCLRVCWDKTLKCDEVKLPPDALIFIRCVNSQVY